MNTPKEAIRLHQKAINDRNIEEYIKTVVFPFTYQNYNGISITVKDEAGINSTSLHDKKNKLIAII